MSIPPVVSEIATVVAAVTALGGGLLWLFQDKLSRWVRAQTQTARVSLEERVTRLEKNHTTHEGELMRIAESMERSSENMGESLKRMTLALERVVDKHEETAMVVARIEGTLERRRPKGGI